MTTKAYFTFADKITQDRMAERTIADKKNRIETNLKASVLINETIIFRAYAAIESDITDSLLANNIHLLENGILIPEYRQDENSLAADIDKHLLKSNSKTKYHRKMKTAELLDAVKTKIKVDGTQLSNSRSFCLALLLFRLALRPNDHFKASLQTSDLIPIFHKLFNQGIPNRNDYLDDIRKLFKNQNDAINLVQSVYFGVGAHYTEANPVWTNEINPHKTENLNIWLTEQPELKKIAKPDLIVAQKFGITDFLEENQSDIEYLNEILSLNQRSERIINNLRISDQDLDTLSFYDIIEIRKTKHYENFNQYVNKNIEENNYLVSRSAYDKEKNTYEKRERALEVSCSILGFVPLVGIFFHLLPATMKIFMNKRTKEGLSHNLPLYSYSEAVTQKVESKNNSIM